MPKDKQAMNAFYAEEARPAEAEDVMVAHFPVVMLRTWSSCGPYNERRIDVTVPVKMPENATDHDALVAGEERLSEVLNKLCDQAFNDDE